MPSLTRRLALAGLVAVLAGCARTAGETPYRATVVVSECREGRERECLHFYEHNWAVFREEALARGYISGYRMLRTVQDSAGLTLVLITEYPDSATYARLEDNFQPMMRELRPEGPSLLNDFPRSEFVADRLGLVTRPGA